MKTKYLDEPLNLIDCLISIDNTQKIGWYDYSTFNYHEYENLLKFKNGDIYWLIPNEVFAFSSPMEK